MIYFNLLIPPKKTDFARRKKTRGKDKEKQT
jgi:hypothetical protein